MYKVSKYFFHSYFPCDPPYVTEEVEEALSFKEAKLKWKRNWIRYNKICTSQCLSSAQDTRLVDLWIVYSLLFDVL